MSSRARLFVLSLVLVNPIVCNVAKGQGLRDRDPNLDVTRKITSDLQGAGMHSGPFYLISRLQLSDIGYDEHFFVPSDSPSGLRFAVSAPQRLYYVPTRKIVASIDLTPSVALVSRGGKKLNFGYASRADLQFLFNHLWLDFNGDLLNALRAKTGEINNVVTTKQHAIGMNGEFKYSSRTSATFSAGTSRTSYPSDRLQPLEIANVLPLLDRSEQNYRVTVRHFTFPLTTLSLASEVSEYKFKRTAKRDSQRTYLGLGASYTNAPLSAYAEAGPASLKFSQPGQHDFSGALGNATITRQFGSRTSLSVNAVRDLDFSIFINNNYYLSDRLGATLNYLATRRLALRLLSQHGRDIYQTAVPSVLLGGGTGSVLRHDTLSFDGVGFNYQRRHIQGGFDVGYYNRDSNVDTGLRNHGIRFLLHLSLSL